MDPDPDPGGPKTRGSDGSGSATLVPGLDRGRGYFSNFLGAAMIL
jgi:hypothetical protein